MIADTMTPEAEARLDRQIERRLEAEERDKKIQEKAEKDGDIFTDKIEAEIERFRPSYGPLSDDWQVSAKKADYKTFRRMLDKHLSRLRGLRMAEWRAQRDWYAAQRRIDRRPF